LKLSAVTQLIAFITFSILINLWSIEVMVILMGLLLSLLIWQKNDHFFRLLKRLKWFFLVMLLIFLFNTPGEHMVHWAYNIKPTYEGAQEGLKQVLRIAMVLGALSLVLAKNTMQELVSGIYQLLKPLTIFGLQIERFAVRLWLTLHYVEQAPEHAAKPKASELYQRLNEAFASEDSEETVVTLIQPTLHWHDYMVIVSLCVLLVVSFMVQYS